MYEKLYLYLVQHNQLTIPGIGTFQVERKPVLGDFANKKIDPPVYDIALNSSLQTPVSKKLVNWLAGVLYVSNREAVVGFNNFVFDMKKQINDGATINWDGVGTISREPDRSIKFIPSKNCFTCEQPVKAEKIIRENASHTVRVGEEEKTSAEMIEMLNQPVAKVSYWWVYALLTVLAAISFIGWYFSEHGLISSSVANTHTVVLPDAGSTYKIAP